MVGSLIVADGFKNIIWISGDAAEILAHIQRGSIILLFFPAPEPDADRSLRLHVERLQYSHRFHHNRNTRGIVGRTITVFMTVDMGAGHDDFRAASLTWNFTDGAVAPRVVIMKCHLDIHGQPHKMVLIGKSLEARVMFRREPHPRDPGRHADLILITLPLDKHGAALALADHDKRAFFREKVAQFTKELQIFGPLVAGGGALLGHPEHSLFFKPCLIEAYEDLVVRLALRADLVDQYHFAF